MEEELEDSEPLLYITYHWNSEIQKLSLHIEAAFFGDRKSISLNPNFLGEKNTALILKGDSLRESYFFYSGMP